MTRPQRNAWLVVVACALCWCSRTASATIDTTDLEAPWPKQHVRELEVRRHHVRWRQYASGKDGIFVGARFVSPASVADAWNISADYGELKRLTPGVKSVRVIEESPTREIVETEIKVLWKTIRLRFEVERDPPRAVRFRLVHQHIGEYRGVCLIQPHGERESEVEMITWLKPAVRLPTGLILSIQRMVFLQGIRNYLADCERAHSAPAPGTAALRSAPVVGKSTSANH